MDVKELIMTAVAVALGMILAGIIETKVLKSEWEGE